jgi:transcriptional regulator with XRE-family HTH domain
MDDRTDGERLGAAVLHLRQGRGEEQQALARRAGVTPAWLSKLERGLIANPGHTTVDALGQALGFRDGDDLLRMFYGHDRFAKARPRTRGRGRPRALPPPDDQPPPGAPAPAPGGCAPRTRRLRRAG